MVIPIIFGLLLAGSSIFALWKGGRSERWVAAIVLIGSVLSVFAQNRALQPWEYGELGTFLIDLSMLFAFASIMFASNRFWPIWMTAAQLLSVVAHAGPALRHSHIAVPFAISEQLWSWVILVQLIVVTTLRMRSVSRKMAATI